VLILPVGWRGAGDGNCGARWQSGRLPCMVRCGCKGSVDVFWSRGWSWSRIRRSRWRLPELVATGLGVGQGADKDEMVSPNGHDRPWHAQHDGGRACWTQCERWRCGRGREAAANGETVLRASTGAGMGPGRRRAKVPRHPHTSSQQPHTTQARDRRSSHGRGSTAAPS